MPIFNHRIFKERDNDIFLILGLLILGITLSVIYWGHKPVPNSDFEVFVNTGHKLLAFQPLSDFKRAPGFGLLVASLSHLTGGTHPDLTAGWVLNSILYPVISVFLFLVARPLIGRSAFFFAVIASLNPYCLFMLTDPIVETTLLCLILVSFHCLFKQSTGSYGPALMATLIRYDGAVLIVLSFFQDFFKAKDFQARIKKIVIATLIFLPILIWMIFMLMDWKNAGPTNYLSQVLKNKDYWVILGRFMEKIWSVGFATLICVTKTIDGTAFIVSPHVAKVFYFCGLGAAVLWGILRKKRIVYTLIFFLIGYLGIHILHGFALDRSICPIAWALLLLCWFAFSETITFIVEKIKFSKTMLIISGGVSILGALIWAGMLLPHMLRYTENISNASLFVPFIACGIVVLGCGNIVTRTGGLRQKTHCLIAAAITILFIVSNQFWISTIMNDGARDREFILLADWYLENAKPGETMVTTLPNVVGTFAPAAKKNFISMSTIQKGSEKNFVNDLLKKKISYIAWDSRIGFAFKSDTYYNAWGMRYITRLKKPKSHGHYKFIQRLEYGNKFINIFQIEENL